MGGRSWWEVRVREWFGPYQSMKKSKFYEASSPKEAASHYTGKGTIMSVTRTGKDDIVEQRWRKTQNEFSEFLSLGDTLLRGLDAKSYKKATNQSRGYETRSKDGTPARQIRIPGENPPEGDTPEGNISGYSPSSK